MSENVYKLVELVGTSKESVTDAIETAISRAGSTIRNLRWFEVVQVRGAVTEGKVDHYQVTLKVGFTLEDD
jgi:flavin-binding protein dodecin